jgi:arginyl tRNA synthetase N terminal domain
MLSKILKDNIGIEKEALTWKESIRTASVPLIKNGKIEEKYVEAMINDIERMGFYVVITDKVAMPHSRPENGVNETSLSLLKLDKIVKYGEYDVNLIFILAAENKDKHIEILKELSEFLDEDDEIEKIINAKTIEEIEKIFKERETELC